MAKTIRLSRLIEQMRSMMPKYCDKCGSMYSKEDLDIVQQDEEKVICKLDCKKCHNSYMIYISSQLDGGIQARRASIKSDISGKEFRKFKGVPQIHQDEVLDLYRALKEVTTITDFEVLFSSNVNKSRAI